MVEINPLAPSIEIKSDQLNIELKIDIKSQETKIALNADLKAEAQEMKDQPVIEIIDTSNAEPI